MKINHTSPFVAPADKAGSAKPVTSTRNERTESVGELQTSALRQNLKASSDIDFERVNQIREAITRGELSLDPDVLAEAVVDMHGR